MLREAHPSRQPRGGGEGCLAWGPWVSGGVQFPSTTFSCLPYCHAVLLQGGSGVKRSFAAQWCFVLGPCHTYQTHIILALPHTLSASLYFISDFQFSHAALGPGSSCHPPIQVAKVVSLSVMLPWGPGHATPLFRLTWLKQFQLRLSVTRLAAESAT